MRNNHKIILAGAVALATVFTACQREQAVDNPNYNAEEGTVKTQFVLNVATANTPTTKQTADNTQATLSNKFRGMEKATLLAYDLDYNVGSNNGGSHVFKATPTATRKYDLGSLLAYDEIKQDQSRRVMELALPVGTNALLFYGTAPKGTLANKVAGSVTSNISEDLTATTFTIDQRMTTENRNIYKESADLIATCMTMLSNAALKQYTAGVDGAKQTRDLRYAFYWPIIDKDNDILDISSYSDTELGALPADGAAGTGTHASQTFHIGETSWAELGEQYIKNNDTDNTNDVTLTPNQEILGQAHAELTTIRSMGGNTELRAGSGSAMQAVATDIYSLADRVSKATPSFWQGETAVLLAQRIKAIIETCFTAGTPVNYRDIASIKNAVASFVDGKAVTDYSHVNTLATFPNNIDMPNGSAIITYNPATRKWSFLTSIPAYGMGGNPQKIDNYLFPAELMYFGNSPIRVTDDSHETAHYPNTVGTWDKDETWATGALAGATGWTNDGAVKSTSRSVAMQKDINYGTALFKSTVKYGAATLQDNNHAIQKSKNNALSDEITGDNYKDEPNATIDINDDTFRVTGILIGGATQTVGWNYVMKEGTSTFDYMIYDNDIPNPTIPGTVGSPSEPNYTLVWDNWNSTRPNNEQAPVYIAVELVNNAKDFWGNANRVRKGGTFYLVGKLDPKNMTFPSRSAKNYNLPPYNDAGATIEASRVFIQDFMTTANFTIGETSLQSAYVTVPDLRSSEISLGLSVDIKWETGLVFDNIILGNI